MPEAIPPASPRPWPRWRAAPLSTWHRSTSTIPARSSSSTARSAPFPLPSPTTTGGSAGWRPAGAGTPPPAPGTRPSPKPPTWSSAWAGAPPPPWPETPGPSWSNRHREEQVRYCDRYVLPAIGHIACRRLTRADFARVVRAAPTASVGSHVTRRVTALVNAGLQERYLLPAQDLLRGVRWHPAEGTLRAAPAGHAITEAEIRTAAGVGALAPSSRRTDPGVVAGARGPPCGLLGPALGRARRAHR